MAQNSERQSSNCPVNVLLHLDQKGRFVSQLRCIRCLRAKIFEMLISTVELFKWRFEQGVSNCWFGPCLFLVTGSAIFKQVWRQHKWNDTTSWTNTHYQQKKNKTEQGWMLKVMKAYSLVYVIHLCDVTLDNLLPWLCVQLQMDVCRNSLQVWRVWVGLFFRAERLYKKKKNILRDFFVN